MNELLRSTLMDLNVRTRMLDLDPVTSGLVVRRENLLQLVCSAQYMYKKKKKNLEKRQITILMR